VRLAQEEGVEEVVRALQLLVDPAVLAGEFLREGAEVAAPHAGVDEGGALVVAFPASEELAHGFGVLEAVLGHEVRVEIRSHGVDAPLHAHPFVHPSRRDVVGAREAAELLAVRGVGAEEEGDAVVHARDVDADVPRPQAQRPAPADAVGDGDAVRGSGGVDGVDALLHAAVELVGRLVEFAGKQVEREGLAGNRGKERAQIHAQHAAGDDVDAFRYVRGAGGGLHGIGVRFRKGEGSGTGRTARSRLAFEFQYTPDGRPRQGRAIVSLGPGMAASAGSALGGCRAPGRFGLA
jgi:hypothetical protein